MAVLHGVAVLRRRHARTGSGRDRWEITVMTPCSADDTGAWAHLSNAVDAADDRWATD